MNQQGMLAKLLAKENLRIQHGNYATAFFDTKSRVLGLPMWKTSGKNVYDLLVGHEVGHALFTPMSGIEKFRQELPEVPFDICNIVEDIRIERMIQDTYPGLATAFRQAYETLIADNFFGLKGKDISKMNFADRLNLHAKAGKAVAVNLTADEQAIYDRCIKAQDFDEVIEICKDIAHLVGKRKEDEAGSSAAGKSDGDKQEDAPQAPSNEDSGDEAENEDSGSSEGSNDGSEQDSADESDNDGEADGGQPSDEQAEDSDEQAPMAGSQAGNTTLKDELTSSTAAAFEQAVKSIQQTDDFAHFLAPRKEAVLNSITPYAKLLEARQAKPRYAAYMNHAATKAHFMETKASAKKYVASLAREFEMRKAAHQYSRASVAKTGTLNMSKLHSYRYSEDIFKSITKLANAKDHGMMMFVDYSSSMAMTLGYVLEHTVNLVMFCRSLNIPFEVYGFTNPAQAKMLDQTAHDEISLAYLSLIQTFSSKMSKAEFDLAIEQTLAQAFFYKGGGRTIGYELGGGHYCQAMSHFEGLSGTPLQECVVAAHTLVSEFRKANPIQKMNVVFLTDGDGSGLIRHQTPAGQKACKPDFFSSKMKGNLGGSEISLNDGNYSYEKLIQNLRKATDSTVVGFFIPNSPNQAIRYAERALDYTRKFFGRSATFKDARATYRKDNSLIIKDGYGFDEYYILASGKDLDIDTDDEFDTDFEIVDIKKSQGKLARAFTEFNNTKRTQRVVLSKFSQVIA